jgi:hypothetical protein
LLTKSSFTKQIASLGQIRAIRDQFSKLVQDRYLCAIDRKFVGGKTTVELPIFIDDDWTISGVLIPWAFN